VSLPLPGSAQTKNN